MAAKEERQRGPARSPRGIQNSRLLAPRPDYEVSKNQEQIPNLQHQAVFNKYDHLLSALPTDICSSINDSLTEIEENAEVAYEQLKALLMSRYTRAFELHKFLEIGDMKPSEMMRQMKALLPPDSAAGTYFMATFLTRLPPTWSTILFLKISRTVTRWRIC
jgi:hypothetical protein